MKVAHYGRIVFGISAAVSGVVPLLRHDTALWQRFLAIVLIAGGVLLLFPRTARVESIAIGFVYGVFALTVVPGMIAEPANPLPYVNFFEHLCVVCGAVAVYAATVTNAARSATLVRAARLALGICAVSFAWAQIVYLQYTASLVPAWIPPNQMFWTILTTIAFALAAIAILTNYKARLAMRMLALMLALFGLLVWVPRIVANPAKLSNWSEISANYLMTAASWLVGAQSV